MSTETPTAGGPGAELRPVIERSWRRSTACGLDRATELRLPYDEDIDDDSRLIRAAQPVMERLATTLSDSQHSLLLADTNARLIHRWVGMKSLYGPLDNASIAPGFGFAEEHAGTNGVGTALEEARVVTVNGTEHFTERLHPFACVGVPIRNPIRGGLEGILDFSCLAKEFNPLMPALLIEVAKHIETRFTQLASASEASLLEHFVRVSRGYRAPVIGLRPNMFLTNTAAAEQVAATDQAILWDVANTYAERGRREGVVELSCGRYSFRLVLVDDGLGAAGGVVLKLSPQAEVQTGPRRPVLRQVASDTKRQGPRPVSVGASRTQLSRPPREQAGRTPQWKRVLDRIEGLSGVADPVAFTGDHGSGKLWAAKRLGAKRGGALRVFDAELERGASQRSLIDRCISALAEGDSVIVRRIDMLAVSVLIELDRLVRDADGQPNLIVTCTNDPRNTVVRVLAGFAHQLWVPPLAQRLDDVVDIVPALLADLEPDRVVTCALPAQQLLMRYSWPGNVNELRDVLATALAEIRGNQIEVKNLPVWLLKQAHRRQLTPLEQSERDLIIDILASVGSNRSEAARVLGIGRATLYRKLQALGIPDGHRLTS